MNLIIKKEIINNYLLKKNIFKESYIYVKTLRKKLIDACNALIKNGVEIIFIKSFKDFPLDSDNFDILIKEEKLNIAAKVLYKLGYKEITRVREPFKWLFRKIFGKIVISIHLHIRVAWEGIIFINNEDIWDKHRIVNIKGLKIGFPSSEHLILITVAHAYFENQSLKLCDLLNLIESIRNKTSINWEYIKNWLEKDNWKEPFITFLKLSNNTHILYYGNKLVANNAFNMLKNKNETNSVKVQFTPIKLWMFNVAPAFIKKVMKTSNFSLSWRIWRLLFTAVSSISLRIPLRREYPNLLISFCGQDGVGKTRNAKGLTRMLPLWGNEKNVKYVWSRGTGTSFNPFLKILRPIFIRSNSTSIKNYRIPLVKEPIKTLWSLIIILDEIIQLLVKVRIPLLLGDTIICDRYIYDVMVDIKCELNKELRWFYQKTILSFIRTPDLTFILKSNISTLKQRRSGLSDDIIKCKNIKYEEYCKDIKPYILCTNNPYIKNRNKALALYNELKYAE